MDKIENNPLGEQHERLATPAELIPPTILWQQVRRAQLAYERANPAPWLRAALRRP